MESLRRIAGRCIEQRLPRLLCLRIGCSQRCVDLVGTSFWPPWFRPCRAVFRKTTTKVRSYVTRLLWFRPWRIVFWKNTTKVPSYVTCETFVKYSTLSIFTSWVECSTLAGRQVVKAIYYPHHIAFENMQNVLSLLEGRVRIGQKRIPEKVLKSSRTIHLLQR